MDPRLNTDPGRFAEEGYCVVPRAVPGPDLPRLREDILACIAEAKAKPAYANLETRHYRDFAAGLHLKKESVRDLLRTPPFLGLAGQLLGPDVDMRFTSTMTKTRERPSALDWHQDAVYDADPDHPKFLVWIAITDALPENGGLRILPGTHRNGLAKHVLSRRFPPDKEIENVDEGMSVDAALRAGDAIAFHPFVQHASWPNVSGALRIGLIAGFMRPKAEYSGTEKRVGFAYLRGGEACWECLGTMT
jgi:hypothetical protein